MGPFQECVLQKNECNYSVELNSLHVHVGKYYIQWACNLMEFNYYLCNYLKCKFDDYLLIGS